MQFFIRMELSREKIATIVLIGALTASIVYVGSQFSERHDYTEKENLSENKNYSVEFAYNDFESFNGSEFDHENKSVKVGSPGIIPNPGSRRTISKTEHWEDNNTLVVELGHEDTTEPNEAAPSVIEENPYALLARFDTEIPEKVIVIDNFGEKRTYTDS